MKTPKLLKGIAKKFKNRKGSTIATTAKGAAIEESRTSNIALSTTIRTDHNILLTYNSHKHVSYPVRTIIRKAIICQQMLKK